MVIYNHLENLVTNTLLAYSVSEENVKRVVFTINTVDCLIINKVHKNQ